MAGVDHDAGVDYLNAGRVVLGQCHCHPVDLLEDGGPLGLGRRVPAMMRSCRPQSRPYCTRMISAPGPVARAAAALMLLMMCLQLRCIPLRGHHGGRCPAAWQVPHAAIRRRTQPLCHAHKYADKIVKNA